MSCAVSPCSEDEEFEVTYVDEHGTGTDQAVLFCHRHARPLIAGRGRPVRFRRL